MFVAEATNLLANAPERGARLDVPIVLPFDLSVATPPTVSPVPVIAPLDVTVKVPVAVDEVPKSVGPASTSVTFLPVTSNVPNELPAVDNVMLEFPLFASMSVVPDTMILPDWRTSPLVVRSNAPATSLVTRVSLPFPAIVEPTVVIADELPTFNCNLSTSVRVKVRPVVVVTPVTASESAVPPLPSKVITSMLDAVASKIRVENFPFTKTSVKVDPALTDTTSLVLPAVLISARVCEVGL